MKTVMKTKMVKMVKMKIMKVVMMNLSSCSGLMQTRGETEKKQIWSSWLHGADYRSSEKSSNSCKADKRQD